MIKQNKRNKTLVFGIGLLAGFFSEINMMILAIVYCMHHNLNFRLHSGNANFKLKNGWTDYFEPFCDELNNEHIDKFDAREKIRYLFNIRKPRRIYNMVKYELSIWYIKKKYGFNFFTFDLWDKICNRNLEEIHYFNQELQINGNLQHACNQVVNNIWKYNETTIGKINTYKSTINLPDTYIGFHIRRGDKFLESDPVDLNRYINLSLQKSNCRNAFVLTDDYQVIEEFRLKYPDWVVYTLCDTNETGYTHKGFFSQDTSTIYEGTVKLLANIEILRNSEHFIGTFSANPGMFLGMIMDPEKTYGVDVPWQVWFGNENKQES